MKKLKQNKKTYMRLKKKKDSHRLNKRRILWKLDLNFKHLLEALETQLEENIKGDRMEGKNWIESNNYN